MRIAARRKRAALRRGKNCSREQPVQKPACLLARALALNPVASRFLALRNEIIEHREPAIPPAAFDPFRSADQSERRTVKRMAIAQPQRDRFFQQPEWALGI